MNENIYEKYINNRKKLNTLFCIFLLKFNISYTTLKNLKFPEFIHNFIVYKHVAYI